MEGYGAVLDRVKSTPGALSATQRWVLNMEPMKIPDLLLAATKADFLHAEGKLNEVRTTDGPFNVDRSSFLEQRRDWQRAYALSEEHGAWVYGRQLILPKQNLLKRIENSEVYGRWVNTEDRLVFVTLNKTPPLLLGFDFEGRFRWQATTSSMSSSPASAVPSFETEAHALTHKTLLLHGTYGRGLGEANRAQWTVQVPLAELSALEEQGSSPSGAR